MDIEADWKRIAGEQTLIIQPFLNSANLATLTG